MKKIILLLCLSVFGSLVTDLAQAAPDPDQARARIAPRLEHLRDIAKQRQKVRVIAQLKSTGSGSHSAQIDNSRRALRTLLAKRNIQAPSEFTDFPLGVYAVSATELNTLIDSGLVEQVAEACYSTNYAAQSVTSLCPGAVASKTGTGSAAAPLPAISSTI